MNKKLGESKLTEALEDGLFVIESCLSNLKFAMSQLSYLLTDQSLFDQLTVNNFYQFKELFFKGQINFTETEHNIEVLNSKIETIENYIKRLKAEMPSKSL